MSYTYSQTLNKNKKNKFIFFIITFLLIAILSEQLNLYSVDIKFSKTNIELSSEEPENDKLLLCLTSTTSISYYQYIYINQAEPNNIQPHYFLRPDTRAPPIS